MEIINDWLNSPLNFKNPINIILILILFYLAHRNVIRYSEYFSKLLKKSKIKNKKTKNDF